jgi:hypothetical protein
MSASSDKMLDLLQQLSVLNQLEDQSRSDSKNSAALVDSKRRQSTRKKIRAEMKQLASHARQESSK